MSTKNVISKELAQKICANSTSIADFCRQVGWQPRGDNYKIFHKYVKEYNLDTSHFTGLRSNIGNKNGCGKKLDDSEFFVSNKLIKSSTVIDRLLKGNYKEYKCENCGIKEWNGNLLNFQLHHINGDHMDNRLENLQLLCPNCHSQTDNYAGKKNLGKTRTHITHKYHCIECGKVLDRATKTGLCKECYIKKTSIANNCPSKKELDQKLLELHSYSAIAKYYNVSDRTIKKWIIFRQNESA